MCKRFNAGKEKAASGYQAPGMPQPLAKAGSCWCWVWRGLYLLLRGSRLSWDRPTPKLRKQHREESVASDCPHSQYFPPHPLQAAGSNALPPRLRMAAGHPPALCVRLMVSPPPRGVPVWEAWGCPHPGGSREDSLRKRRRGAELVLQDAGRHNLRRGHGSHALQSLILRDLVLRGKGGTGGKRGYRGRLSSLDPSVPDRFCKAGSQSHSPAEGPVQRDPPHPLSNVN